MQELVGRLTALDPQASETLKVVAYFDALVSRGVGLDGLLRAAAALSGVVAGAEQHGRTTRYDPSGRRVADPEPRRSVSRQDGWGRVWLEREGLPHANDEMIVERLSLAAALIGSRRRPAGELEVIIDAARPVEERSTALARLRLEPDTRIRIVATDADSAGTGGPTAEVPTRYGILRATLDRSGTVGSSGRTGLGPWVRADHAPESWEGAIVAHRLADPATPIVDAADLGVMLDLVRAYQPGPAHDDVRRLAGLDSRTAEILRVLVEADSIRAAATRLAMHHSTLQARHESLIHQLGYDPRTTAGRMRYIAAELLRRLEIDGRTMSGR